jgi:MraZ protein
MSEAWGASFIKLDDKNRIILPAKFRAALADGAYLTRGHDECVFLFSRPQFDTYREHTRAHAPPGMPAIAFDRVFYSSVVIQEPDKQGRITIPQMLRDYAGLSRDLAVIGMEERMEIWDGDRWQTYLSEFEPMYAKLSEGVR